MSIIQLKGARFEHEECIPGETEKRGIGAMVRRDPPENHDVWYDTETHCVHVRHKSGRHSELMVPMTNVKGMYGLQPAEPDAITSVENVAAVVPPTKTLVVEKSPVTGKGVGRIVVGGADED